jgi:hypothetical protein
MSIEDNFAQVAQLDIDAEDDERIEEELEAEATEPPLMQDIDLLIERKVEEALVTVLERVIMGLRERNMTGNDLLRPPTTKRREFTEYETTIMRLKDKFGTDVFEPFGKRSIAVKCTKVSDHQLREYLQIAITKGDAECMDPDTLRMKWRMIFSAEKHRRANPTH